MEPSDPVAIVIAALNSFEPSRDDTDNLYRLYQLFEGFGSLPDRHRAAPAMLMRGLLAIPKPGAAEARTQGRSLQGRSAAEDGEHGFLVPRGMAAAQAAQAAPGCRQGKKAARSRCGAQPLPAPSPF